jgi:RNA polymerase sigma-70 factor (sigma-E family)
MTESDFDDFCRLHYRSIERLAVFVTGDRSEAQEIAQEAFARAFSHWKRVQGLEAPEAWVQRVAANLAISAARRARVRRAFVPERRQAEEQPQRLDGEIVKQLKALTPSQRAVVVLRFLEDRSVEQVATELGKAPGTIRALTAQAMKQLRAQIPLHEEVGDDA